MEDEVTTTGLKVFSRRALCGTIARCLAAAALALAPLAAEATELDLLLTQNPALGRIAAADPAKGRRLLDAINQVLRRPEPLRTRSPFDLSAEDEALLAE